MNNPDCPDCYGNGWYRLDVPFGDPRFGKLIRCECKAAEDAERLQSFSGLSDLERQIQLQDIYESIADDRPDTIQMVQFAGEFVEHPDRMVVFYGGVGNSKTAIGMAVVNECIKRGIPAIYMTAFNLVNYIRDAFTDERIIKDDSAFQRLRQFEEIRALVIDEFDKIKISEWAREQLTQIIDTRYRLANDGTHGTIIIMNASPKETLAPHHASRLYDGRNIVIENNDADLRPFMQKEF